MIINNVVTRIKKNYFVSQARSAVVCFCLGCNKFIVGKNLFRHHFYSCNRVIYFFFSKALKILIFS